MPDRLVHALNDLDVAGYLRPTGSRPAEFLDQKLEDHRAFSIAMMLTLGPVGAFLWIWDYVINPGGAYSTVGLRLAVMAVGIVSAVIFMRVRNRIVLQAVVATALLGAVFLFSAIVRQLAVPPDYSISGYMFFALAVILVTQAFSAEYGMGLAVAIGAFPQFLGLIGFVPGFHNAHYAVLIWPEIGMTCIALLAFSYNYGKLYDTRLQLERVSAIDPLTGVGNRRLFMPIVEKEMARSKRFGHPVSLLMLDIDEFKRVNDTLGHPIGDVVLKQLAETCRRTVRESDTLARLGGDEFAILLPETDIAGAFELAEKLRVAVESSPALDPDGHVVRHTVSVGAAQARDSDIRETTLIARADEALYEAKESGRNCVRGQLALQRRLPALESVL